STRSTADVSALAIIGAPDVNDTLTANFASGPIAVPIFFDGGAAGYDTLNVIGGTHVTSASSGPQSGTVTVDGTAITYTNLEPVSISGAPNVEVDGTSDDDAFQLSQPGGSGTDLQISGSSTETISVSGATSVKIAGGDGTDSIEVTGNVTLPGIGLTI